MKNLALLIILTASACHNFKDQSPLLSPAEGASNALLLDSTWFRNQDLACRQSVKEFYASRDFSLYWRGFTPAADSLTQILQRVNRFGLIPQDYHLNEIEKLLKDTLSTDRVSRLDVLLTDSYLTLHAHIRRGRLDPKTLQRLDLSSAPDAEAIADLQNIRNTPIGGHLQSLEPEGVQYHQLKNALQSFELLGKDDAIQRNRAVQISLNLERWRWQKPWPDRYVLVNIPSFLLHVVENDSLWLESKVIVGKRETPTPVLESVIQSFIIYPYWHAPFSISTREILPALQADASYLQKNNFEVLNTGGTVINPDTIQWRLYSADEFPFILRQREGSENSMGIIKFNFANNYGVYLHDTNSKRLYQRAHRDLSHGCVRVGQAVALAHYLVREDDIYVSPEDLDQYLSLQQRLKIELRKPIPLKLEYFTAEVKNGVTFFYDDIYRKDSVMMESLYNPMPAHIPSVEKPVF
ncbi:MAG TPA: L,D-transpeptidase family protein [Flavitalea sp.]|nr:L,D-transpeptidase family protein [Flavitalea sp.]